MSKLKKWLLTNTVFSFTSGVFMILLNPYFKSVFGIDVDMIFPLIGANLIVFAGIVFWISKYQLQNIKWIYTICILDMMWVLGSVIILMIHPSSILNIGYWIMMSIAIFVGVMGIMQFKHSRAFS